MKWKKIILVGSSVLLFLFLFLAGCGSRTQEDLTTDSAKNASLDSETGCSTEYIPICGTDGLTYQNSCYSSLRNIGVKSIGVCEYTVCSFNGMDHYVMNNMLYYEDDKGRPYIDVLYGTFYQKPEGDGWVYLRAINKDSSYYSNRMQEYVAGVTESEAVITCETTTELPEQLKEFLKTHGKILKLKIEGYEEDVSSDADTNLTEETVRSEEVISDEENMLLTTA